MICRSELLQLVESVELTAVLGEGHGDADGGVVAIGRHADGVRPGAAAGVGAVGEDVLLPVDVFQHRGLAVERDRVGAPEVPVVAELVLVAVVLLAHLLEPEGHVVAVLADALRFRRRAACARHVEVLVQAVAVVHVRVHRAVDVAAAALAPETSEGVGAHQVMVACGDDDEEGEEEFEQHFDKRVGGSSKVYDDTTCSGISERQSMCMKNVSMHWGFPQNCASYIFQGRAHG